MDNMYCRLNARLSCADVTDSTTATMMMTMMTATNMAFATYDIVKLAKIRKF